MWLPLSWPLQSLASLIHMFIWSCPAVRWVYTQFKTPAFSERLVLSFYFHIGHALLPSAVICISKWSVSSAAVSIPRGVLASVSCLLSPNSCFTRWNSVIISTLITSCNTLTSVSPWGHFWLADHSRYACYFFFLLHAQQDCIEHLYCELFILWVWGLNNFVFVWIFLKFGMKLVLY